MQLNTHAPTYTELAEIAAVPLGTSHVTTKRRCKNTTWVDNQNALYKASHSFRITYATKAQRVCWRADNSAVHESDRQCKQTDVINTSDACWQKRRHECHSASHKKLRSVLQYSSCRTYASQYEGANQSTLPWSSQTPRHSSKAIRCKPLDRVSTA